MRVLVAMSGGVDSSVAAALLRDAGHDVVGATMKLWGGESDSGCCSVSDVTDARRVADELGIDHHVFNFTEAFEASVVGPYVDEHVAGRTPNPCAECNRHLKFGQLLDRAERLGFDALATGHHARVERIGAEGYALRRGRDRAKDQSYVLGMLGQKELSRILLPVGELTKAEVRASALARGLKTATKPDSQDVCFISSHTKDGRGAFLGDRMEFHAAAVVDRRSGSLLGRVEALELLTVGQRRGLPPAGAPRYVLDVDHKSGVVLVGSEDELVVRDVELTKWTWSKTPQVPGTVVAAQSSAHGACRAARITAQGLAFDEPVRRIAPGQLVVFYEGDAVVGSGIAN